MMSKYVIIGNGTAAVGCIEGIRSRDAKSEITVVSAENTPVYCRPLISYYLEGKTDLDRMKYRPDSFYADNGCTVLYGRKAVSVDNSAKMVMLDDRSSLKYDYLCIAAGSSPFVPQFKGLDTVKHKFTFMTIEDTLALEENLDKSSHVLIIGAGLIGLKCAEGIAERVSEITVCDLSDRILSSILDSECAVLMQKCLEENGVKFLLNDSAESFDTNTAVMKSGKTVDFDVLVLAVGVKPNTSLLKEIGGEVNKGIIVNDKMQTSIDNIYAAGDCTEGMDISLGDRRILAIMPNAYMQGHCAGVNMAGGKERFDKAIPMNSIGFFGLHAITAGSCFTEEQGGESFEEKSEGSIKRLYFKDGFLTGYMLVGNVERAGIYTKLIREKTPLSEIDTDTMKKKPSLTIFSRDNRRNSLGGTV